MAKLTTNHCLYWLGTGASIPAGFSRHEIGTTARFLSGAPAGDDPGLENGSLTHTHTTTAHTHTGDSHTHSFSGASVTHPASGTPSGDGAGSFVAADATHAHGSANSTGATITYQTALTVTAANSSGTSTPPYTEALLIKPDADGADIPAGASVLFQSATPPSGFDNHDGVGATPDLTGDFIRIAANATTDGGATGGNLSHTHSADHTHTADNHGSGHDGSNIDANADSGTGAQNGIVGQPIRALQLSHHPMTFSDTATTVNSATHNTDASGDDRPRNITLAPIKNTGSAAMPDAVIVPYIGTLAALAALSDWLLCDGTGGTPDIRSIQPKCAFTSLETTSGSNTHSHNFSAHGHTHSGTHTHTATGAQTAGSKRLLTADGALLEIAPDTGAGEDTHDHTWTVSSDTPTLQNATIATSGSTDHRDPYLEVLWAKYVAPTVTSRSWGAVIG